MKFYCLGGDKTEYINVFERKRGADFIVEFAFCILNFHPNQTVEKHLFVSYIDANVFSLESKGLVFEYINEITHYQEYKVDGCIISNGDAEIEVIKKAFQELDRGVEYSPKTNQLSIGKMTFNLSKPSVDAVLEAVKKL